MSNLIAEAITEAFGERCPDVGEYCPCCQAWALYDDMVRVVEIANRNEKSPEGDRLAASISAGERP